MIRKIAMSLSVVLLLSFVSCGGGSSKEAKALLQKILQFKGIPQEILVNICQDENKNGICGADELFTKVRINKNDSADDIFQKISLTDDGKYFLQTYNPKLPILIELKDVAKVIYDEGRFTLNFNGFKTIKDDNETKEISILESMIDSTTLNKNEADNFRTLNNADAQDKYYTMLLDTLETNINILREKGLDSKRAITAIIKEMGIDTKNNQEQANRINNCNIDQTCVDEEIKNLSDELIVQSPVANAGKDKNAKVNQTIIITGAGVDPDGSIVSYKWTKGNSVGLTTYKNENNKSSKTVVLATTASFPYTPITVGKDILTLTVTDNDGNTNSDTMTVTVYKSVTY